MTALQEQPSEGTPQKHFFSLSSVPHMAKGNRNTPPQFPQMQGCGVRGTVLNTIVPLQFSSASFRDAFWFSQPPITMVSWFAAKPNGWGSGKVTACPQDHQQRRCITNLCFLLVSEKNTDSSTCTRIAPLPELWWSYQPTHHHCNPFLHQPFYNETRSIASLRPSCSQLPTHSVIKYTPCIT